MRMLIRPNLCVVIFPGNALLHAAAVPVRARRNAVELLKPADKAGIIQHPHVGANFPNGFVRFAQKTAAFLKTQIKHVIRQCFSKVRFEIMGQIGNGKPEMIRQ